MIWAEYRQPRRFGEPGRSVRIADDAQVTELMDDSEQPDRATPKGKSPSIGSSSLLIPEGCSPISALPRQHHRPRNPSAN